MLQKRLQNAACLPHGVPCRAQRRCKGLSEGQADQWAHQHAKKKMELFEKDQGCHKWQAAGYLQNQGHTTHSPGDFTWTSLDNSGDTNWMVRRVLVGCLRRPTSFLGKNRRKCSLTDTNKGLHHHEDSKRKQFEKHAEDYRNKTPDQTNTISQRQLEHLPMNTLKDTGVSKTKHTHAKGI